MSGNITAVCAIDSTPQNTPPPMSILYVCYLQLLLVMDIHVMMEPVFLYAGSVMVTMIVVMEKMNRTAQVRRNLIMYLIFPKVCLDNH